MQQQPEETRRNIKFLIFEEGIVHRSQVWTGDGRPHPAVTRTLQYAADFAACRNWQRMSAKALRHRWKHEIQIAFLWQRSAAMTLAVLPSTSAREERLLAGLIDRVTSHWIRAPPLDGGDDDDADTRTDTTIPDDDNEDITSFTSQQTTAL